MLEVESAPNRKGRRLRKGFAIGKSGNSESLGCPLKKT